MANSSPSLLELAERIQKQAKSLQEGLEKGGYPQPTLEADSIEMYPTALQDELLFKARMLLIDASQAMLEYAL